MRFYIHQYEKHDEAKEELCEDCHEQTSCSGKRPFCMSKVTHGGSCDQCGKLIERENDSDLCEVCHRACCKHQNCGNCQSCFGHSFRDFF